VKSPVFVNYDGNGKMKIFERFFSRKPTPKTEAEIAALIEGFANGTGGILRGVIGFVALARRMGLRLGRSAQPFRAKPS
jgi:hypothetical protein